MYKTLTRAALVLGLVATIGIPATTFETVNGRITVELPDNTNADVRAETLNGGISSDFRMTVSGRFGSRRLNGTIGNGGRELRLKTVNGPIRLRRTSGL